MRLFDFSNAVQAAVSNVGDVQQAIAIQNKVMDEQWRKTVVRIGWRLLTRNDSFDPANVDYAVVVGVGVYSQPDLDALDSLYLKTRDAETQVFVFSVTDCPDLQRLARFMPGVSRPLQTPILAEYRRGQLVMSREGKAAREWMGAV